MVEVLGLTATLIVLISFCFKKEKLIRIINAIGAFIFVIYGLLLPSISTSILNGALIIIHIFNLLKGECIKNE